MESSWKAFLFSVLIGIFSVYYYLKKKFRCSKACERPSVGIVVLGDLGRSPRMQHHALALRNYYSKEEVDVHLIGMEGTLCREELESSSSIHIQRIPSPFFERYRHLLQFPHYLSLWHVSAFSLCIDNGTVLVIDAGLQVPLWVEFGYRLAQLWLFHLGLQCVLGYVLSRSTSIRLNVMIYKYMAFSVQNSSRRIVRIYEMVEKYCGHFADSAFCVSNEMRKQLIMNQWAPHSGSVKVLYDRPLHFVSLTKKEIHEFKAMYFPENAPRLTKGKTFELKQSASHTVSWFSLTSDELRVDRPAMFVTGTSWTPDENMDMLFNVLCRYNAAAPVQGLPSLVMVITGKGKLQEEWLKMTRNVSWSHVYIFTGFLPYSDYLKMLFVADMGLCLHTSSSGVDLPMKAVDMRSASLPILAFKFPVLSEVASMRMWENLYQRLITVNETGDVFESEDQLFDKIVLYLKGFRDEGGCINTLKNKARNNKFDKLWFDVWSDVAGPSIDSFLLRSTNDVK